MKVLRGQETNLESSKVFYRGSRSTHTVFRHPCPEIMRISENLCKSLTIYENQCKFMKYDESHQRTRSQPGIEQRFLEGQQVSATKIHACKHAKFEPLISKAAIVFARRFDILSSKHRGLERSTTKAVACE